MAKAKFFEEYIEKLKDELSHDDEQTSEKKGFFSKLFGL